jgi:hypothetical protein
LSLTRGVALLATLLVTGCGPLGAPFAARPPGGQTHVITVVNESPRPALLVVAEVTEDGIAGRLVGIASPGVVPAGATVDVTFGLPPGEGWAIFINPGPNRGPIFGPAELPLTKSLGIDEGGNPHANICDSPVDC